MIDDVALLVSGEGLQLGQGQVHGHREAGPGALPVGETLVSSQAAEACLHRLVAVCIVCVANAFH